MIYLAFLGAFIAPRFSKDGKPLPDAPPYKAYKGDSNYCYELFTNERKRWDGEVITTFRANQSAYRKFMHSPRYRNQTFDGRPLIMRLCINDMLAIEENGQRKIMRIVGLSPGDITLAEHFEGGVLRDRNKNNNDSFRYIRKSPGALSPLKVRRVFVTPLGQLLDPGFKP